MYSTVDDAVKMVVANKVDKVCAQRQYFPCCSCAAPCRLLP